MEMSADNNEVSMSSYQDVKVNIQMYGEQLKEATDQ